jgi:ubiquinone/menaquinone biosynthesis C-methylase UbiE
MPPAGADLFNARALERTCVEKIGAPGDEANCTLMALTTEDLVISSWHEDLLKDGGPEVYNKCAPEYDEHFEATSRGPESVFKVWMTHYKKRSGKHRVFDAGCGTGFVGQCFTDLVSQGLVELYGGDLSSGMLELAKSKNVYADLQIVNLQKPLPYDAESFDSITCSGVFVQAHCGPETLPYLTHVLKKGGIVVATIRRAFFESTKQDWEREVQECGCEIVEQLDVPYLGDMTAVLLVIRKL